MNKVIILNNLGVTRGRKRRVTAGGDRNVLH